MTDASDMNNQEWKGKVEAQLQSFGADLANVAKALGMIQDQLGRAGKLNTGLLITIILSTTMVIGAAYAATIAPLKGDIGRHEAAAATLAQAVLEKEAKLAALAREQVRQDADIAVLQGTLKEVRLTGSPVMAQAVALLEYRLAQVEKLHTK